MNLSYATTDGGPPLAFPSCSSSNSSGYSNYYDDYSPASDVVRDDHGPLFPFTTKDVIITIIGFWFLVSMCLKFFGFEDIKFRERESILIKPYPLFVDHVKVDKIGGAASEVMLYGFDGTPSLSVVTNVSESRKTSLPRGAHKEWMYLLNKGSQIDISYNVTSSLPSPLVLVIVEGNRGLTNRLQDPAYPKSTVLWHRIYGTGAIGLGIPKSASYYVAVGNLNSHTVEVELQITIRALLHDPTKAYYNCTISRGTCVLKIPFTGGNSALLAFSDPNGGIGNTKTHVRISYGPRWITYLILAGGSMIILIPLVSCCLNESQSEVESSPKKNMEHEGAPLIPRNDDDVASLGSSYDSLSDDADDPEDRPSASSHNHDYDNKSRTLCAICCYARRDSFFLTCGHCVSCYACGTKIAEVAGGTCPICRRPIKKVKKIYPV